MYICMCIYVYIHIYRFRCLHRTHFLSFHLSLDVRLLGPQQAGRPRLMQMLAQTHSQTQTQTQTRTQTQPQTETRTMTIANANARRNPGTFIFHRFFPILSSVWTLCDEHECAKKNQIRAHTQIQMQTRTQPQTEPQARSQMQTRTIAGTLAHELSRTNCANPTNGFPRDMDLHSFVLGTGSTEMLSKPMNLMCVMATHN